MNKNKSTIIKKIKQSLLKMRYVTNEQYEQWLNTQLQKIDFKQSADSILKQKKFIKYHSELDEFIKNKYHKTTGHYFQVKKQHQEEHLT